MIEKLQDLKKQYNPLLFDLLCGVITSIFFSTFLYLEHFGITIKLLNTIFALFAFAMLLYMPKRAILIAGFLIGILWFYWIGYSFKYNGINNIETLITIAFAAIYMLFFGVLALSNSIVIRAILLFGLSFFEPVDFNWMQLELLFVDSYFGLLKYQLAIIITSISLVGYMKKKYRYAPLLLLLAALNFNPSSTKEAPLKIKLVSTDVKQEKKWKKESISPTIELIYSEIRSAKDEGYDLIIFPESVFPFYMNQASGVIAHLQDLSHDITIVAGSLLNEDGTHYNVTYMFNEGSYEVAKKMVLVPFGEYIPLPDFAKKFINEIFFAGASDFKTADKPTDFLIKGTKFRNAICYEATCQEIYDGDVNFVIASSNNAWFYPSIEPTLQKLLMRFYARKNGVTIYHSANWNGSGIVR